ncbi:MAG: phosphopantothenoylcysteine decarboxylase, partial [Pirellulaceae bacterium]|nr:phosphopantothenoylcysteine decarboxylase [Pirellulaceae bacterium]
MARILITSGPTREYLDPVRYLSNGSSGRMGSALARAVLDAGHEAVVVTGPVEADYPPAAEVIRVVSTEEMRDACLAAFPTCQGLIAAAAPCDYRPVEVAPRKLPKNGRPLVVEFIETPDIVASLAEGKQSRWIVAFALETHDHHARAMDKLRRKQCDLIVVNGPAAINSPETSLEVLDKGGRVAASITGDKVHAAEQLFALIADRLLARS